MYGTLVYGPMYAHDVYSQIKGYCRQGCEIHRNDIRLLGPLEQILLAGYVSRSSCLCTIHIRCHTLPLCLHFYVMMHARMHSTITLTHEGIHNRVNNMHERL